MEIDTVNDSLVAARGDKVLIMRLRPELSREEALRLAAWLVAIADMSEENADFKALLKAVQST